MAKIIGLPKLSPTMEEGTLVAWTKQEGDSVDVDELLAEVETDKATMEFRSFDKGVLLKILVPVGETLAPDTPVAILGKAGEDISALLEQVAAGKGGAKPAAGASQGSAAAGASGAQETTTTASQPGTAALASPVSDADEHTGAATGRVLSSPLVRKMAREQGIDLHTVRGSGPRGRVIKRDLEGLSSAGHASTDAAGPSRTAGSGWERRPPRVEKASGTRKTIARRLTESKREVPHYYLTVDFDMDAMVAARTQLNEALAGAGKVSFNDLVIKACALALRDVPECNASWGGDVIRFHQVVDISVAVAVPDGLITPVVRDADKKGVSVIAEEVRSLAQRAKDKKLRLEEISEGTFSISNLGMYGIEEFAAVINPPEGAILAVGALREEPVVRDGQVVVGRRMKATLSADHRVIDGAIGARFLQALRGYIERPIAMLL
ncbi:MAG: pyruvate dehydrogenase complex dihydrolipoamide acetyltransferase [Sandaracinaceae bacterium]|nr:pyruvate dehydrogenase complex dihydrolipoamide acetyltransferase [Myxococcales bacterium]MCB9657538.1 pyruvate dehydrogenase complex dihydrolipoamide acetyltransferase [Sandaracinaceae bacterium]